MYIILTVLILSWIGFILSLILRGAANISSDAADMASNGAKIGPHGAQCNRHGEADTPWGRQCILVNTFGKKTFFFKGAQKTK